jgi:hypothetical protein
MRRERWERDKSLARRLTDAFIRNNKYCEAQQRSFRYVPPWQDLANEMSPLGWHADGLEPNCHTMELFCKMGVALGLAPKLVSVEDYFAEYLESI